MKRKDSPATGPVRARKKFLRYFRRGFRDETYLEWERNYKWLAHERWLEVLEPARFESLLGRKRFAEIAGHAVSIESRTNLLFSFEKMALRDAVKSGAGARAFATGLYQFLHGSGSAQARFEAWCETVATLPRRQTRVLTWPLVTVWGFIGQPAPPLFPETERHQNRSASLRIRFRLPNAPELGNVFEPAGVRRAIATRFG